MFRLLGTTKDQLVVDGVSLVIKHHHMYMHHHGTRAMKGQKLITKLVLLMKMVFELNKYVKLFCIFIVLETFLDTLMLINTFSILAFFNIIFHMFFAKIIFCNHVL